MVAWTVGLMAMIALAGEVLRKTTHCAWFQIPVRYVRLEGQLDHIRPAEVEQVLKPLLKDGCWGWDLSPLQAAVKQLAWVDEVRIKRVWPDVIEVGIKEHLPYARWGEKDLLNAKGERFTPAGMAEFVGLPRLDGPEGHEKQLFSAYREMAEALARLQLKLIKLEVDARRSWQLTLEYAAHEPGVQGEKRTMVIVLGRTQPKEVFAKVVGFLTLLPAEQRQRIYKLDARYEHGFAVQWRESSAFIEKTINSYG